MLENSIVENMSKSTEPQQPQAFMDNLVLDTFTEKFNEKYSKALSEEQKQLLSHYITSFADNAVELKTYLNEEIARLRAVLVEASKEMTSVQMKVWSLRPASSLRNLTHMLKQRLMITSYSLF